jgi:putative addiction module component (TIGR02574 family)
MTVSEKKQVNALVAKMEPDERVELADRLYATLPNAYLDSVNRAWDTEIKRRLEEYESGRAKLIPAREVHARVSRRLNEIKARRASPRRVA